MAGTATWELQKAVYAALTADAALMALITGIFDHVPQGQAYPYLTVGDDTETDRNTFDRTGREPTMTLHLWSKYAGMKQAKDIAERVVTLLDDQALVVTGWGHVMTTYEFGEFLRDPDGETRHGVLRFRMLLQEA